MSYLAGRLSIGVKDLRSGLNRWKSPRIVKLLQEDFAEDSVSLLSEDRAEHDCHSVIRGDYVDGFFLPRVMPLSVFTCS